MNETLDGVVRRAVLNKKVKTMMLLKILGTALLTLILTLLLRPIRPEYALTVSLCGASVMLMLCVDSLAGWLSSVKGFLADSQVSLTGLSGLIKGVGIGYLCELFSSTAADFGQSALSAKILLAGRLAIFWLAVPLLCQLYTLAISLVNA